jgi:hypothetical protein
VNRPGVPDGIEPIVGWRYWNLDQSGSLKSANLDSTWRPGEIKRAYCTPLPGNLGNGAKRRPHPAPDDACSCGIYASRDLKSLRKSVALFHEDRLVVGEVMLWGRVIPGERGYRGEFAYPRSLYLVPETFPRGSEPQKIAVGLRGRYGVEGETLPLRACRPQNANKRAAFGVLFAWALLGFTLTLVRIAIQLLAS